jgi:hypothetical protein
MANNNELTPPPAAYAPAMPYDQSFIPIPQGGPTIQQAGAAAAQAAVAQNQATQSQDNSQQQQPQYQPTIMPAPMSGVPQTMDQRARGIGIADWPQTPQSIYSDDYAKGQVALAQAAQARLKSAATDFQNAYEHPHRLAAAAGALLASRKGYIPQMIGGLIQSGAGKDLTTKKALLDFAKNDVATAADSLKGIDESRLKYYEAQIKAQTDLSNLTKAHQDIAAASQKMAQYPLDAAAATAEKEAKARADDALVGLRKNMADWYGPKAWGQIEKNLASANNMNTNSLLAPGNAQAKQFQEIASGNAALANAGTNAKNAESRQSMTKAHIEHLGWLEQHGNDLDENSKNSLMTHGFQTLAGLEQQYAISDPETKKALFPELQQYRKQLERVINKLGMPKPPAGTVAVGSPIQQPLQPQQAQMAMPQTAPQRPVSQGVPTPEQFGALKQRAMQGDKDALAQMLIIQQRLKQAQGVAAQQALPQADTAEAAPQSNPED